ncbi:MAG TPA: hypothetical protein VHT28_18470 [Silvibacterium sp.]|nr:hypothetical protein [Silvibacterium sp.]
MSTDLGGHIVEHSGSDPMYATLVNIQSGPRILNNFLQMRAVDPAHAIVFDRLSSSSFGYGGDPYNVTNLNFSKGRIYDFYGSFRRNRQYFDYNLLANPLIPPESTPFVPILSSPHLFNTVRRMTDVNIKLAPLSIVSPHFGYFQNVNQGPTNSTLHVGADALLTQNWRVSTDVWNGGIDWKPLARTTISYDQFFTHYKGNTSWQLTGLDYKLSDGTPVSLGINLSSVWNTPCAAPFNPDGTVNPTCNGFLAYSRSAPTRTLFPSEQFHFQSSSIPNVTMNGRVLYMGTTSNLINYNEYFNGLNSRPQDRATETTGSAAARRINVNVDYGITWQVTPTISLNDVFDFWSFRQPATNLFTETSFAGTSMLAPPGAATTTTTSDYQALNQNTKINTLYVAWDAAPRARVSLGYLYSNRRITDAGGDNIPIHSYGALFGLALRPTSEWRINFNVDAIYADNSFTRISPRATQHYRLRTSYNPHPWLSLAGTINILEDRNNVQTVHHLAHDRDFSFAAMINPNEKWGIDLNYAYNSIFSRTDMCYTSTPPVEGAQAQPSPPVCQQAGLPLQTNGYYNQPTQYGSIGFVFNPVKRLHTAAGYRMSAVNGQAPPINIRQVPGSLQSQYQIPYANLAFDLNPNWSWKADYNYYSYGEGTPIGPTLPRSFRGNVYTLGVRYAF